MGRSDQPQASAALPPKKDPRYHMEVGWAPEPVWRIWRNFFIADRIYDNDLK